MPRLVVMDALGLAYRAYYALARWGRNDQGERYAYPALSNSRKEPTNAIYGMANLFVKFRRELKPDRWALAWDGPGPTFRHELYPRYKEHRPAMPEELNVQLTPIEDLARCMSLPVIEKAGMEADDVMATLSRIGADAGYEVLLITGDKDMLQLVDESVMVLSPQAKGDDYARLDAEGVRAKWGVPPEQIRDVLALMGDATDGYPGVPGVGEKTAVELLTTFGSVDAMYERLAEIKKPALLKKLEENKALAYLSRELATVRRDLDLGLSLDDLAVAPIRRDELMAFAKRWEVRRLEQVASDLGVADAQAGAAVPQRPAERRGTAAEQSSRGRERTGSATTATVEAPSQPDLFGVGTIARPAAPLPASLAGAQGDLFASMNAEAGVDAGTGLDGLTNQGLDGLTNRVHEVRARALHGLAVLPIADGDSPRRSKLVGVALAARSGHHCYVPLAHEAGPNVSADQFREWFGPILIDRAVAKVAHDWKRALHELAAGQVGVSHPSFDVRLGSFLCDPQRNHSILALAGDVLGVGLDGLEAPVVRGRPRPGLAALPVGAAAARAGRQAAALLPLAEALRAQLEAREQWKLYRK